MDAPFLWREITPSDLPTVKAIADQVHPSFPEELAVFAERRQLYPLGMRLLERDGIAIGYLISHPWRLGTLPALNALLRALPPQPDT
jgi:hypothetical protein